MILPVLFLMLPLLAAGTAQAQDAAPRARAGLADAADLRQLARFKPFRNESDAVMIGDLAVENRRDRIALHGSLVITRDLQGLALARSLKQLIDATVADLQAAALPNQVRTRPSDSVASPFAAD